MEILKTQVLRGANVWSRQVRKLIQIRLDTTSFPLTDRAAVGRIKSLIDSAWATIEKTHINSASILRPEELTETTDVTHLFAHLALQLQNFAGMEVSHYDTRTTTSPNIRNIVFEYEQEEAGLYAAQASCAAINVAMSGKQPDLTADLTLLQQLRQRHGLSRCLTGIIDEAATRGIPSHVRGSEVILGYGKYRKTFRGANNCDSAPNCNSLHYDENIKTLLAEAGIPLPKGAICSGVAGMIDLIDGQGFPISIRPANSNNSAGMAENIHDMNTARHAFAEAQEHSHSVVVEQYIPGADFRLLVVGGKFVAAAQRIPASVTGDGHSTIRELIHELNRRPERADGAILNRITFDKDTFLQLDRRGYHYESVPPVGEQVLLKSTSTLTTGATATDATNDLHPANRFMAERIAALTELPFCGIDIRATDLVRPISESGGVVLQVTDTPSLRMHLSPSEGMPRNVASAILDMLFPDKVQSCVPIIAITGTNGKTTTTRLLAHLAKQCGYAPGYTSTDGVYIGDYRVQNGDSSGPQSAALILRDPMVDLAILETARGGLLRSGLGFEHCDVGIITNIQEDHLGLGDIETLEDLARVKAVVAYSIRDTGTAVLNADDAHCVKIGSQLSCNITWFTLDPDNALVRTHIADGGTAVVLQDAEVHLYTDHRIINIGAAREMPLSLGGAARFMIANILAVTGAAYAQNFSIAQIRHGLKTFVPSFEQSPGRMNLFELRGFHVLVDYAHNAHGLLGMRDYLQNIQAKRKIGIITAVGDRRDEDILRNAEIAAEMFDQVIVRLERDLRGRTGDEINQLIIRGLRQSGKNIPYELITDEADAVCRAIDLAKEGDFIVVFSEEYRKIAGIIRQQQAQGLPPGSDVCAEENKEPLNNKQ